MLKEQPDSISDTGSVVSSSSNHSTKSESKKHPSLPKEVSVSVFVSLSPCFCMSVLIRCGG